jgi:hypothetical protein
VRPATLGHVTLRTPTGILLERIFREAAAAARSPDEE